MIGTGKYNFEGIRKAGALALSALLSSTGWGASIIASPFKPVINLILEWFSEWLANKGLLIINLGAIYINGEIDQDRFDKAFDEALNKVKIPGLTEDEKRAIDDEIIKAIRKFGRIGNAN